VKVAATLEYAPLLVSELQNFRLKQVSLKTDDVLAWREYPHDDLVLAMAVALWEAEHPVVVDVILL
jgi:hypothetical protein